MTPEKIEMLVGLALILGYLTIMFIRFLDLPTEEKKKKIAQVAYDWVKSAEDKYGGGTNKIKLAHAYSLFVGLFPNLSKWISVAEFDKLIQDAVALINEQVKKLK